MPYERIAAPPPAVKNHLPKQAREILLAAFNSAVEQYQEGERAFKTAKLVQ